jgi:general stress protein 26
VVYARGMPVQLSEEREHILGFLKNHEIGVLATVDPNGDPSAAAIYFAVDDSLGISFLTKTGTKKHDNLKRHASCILVVYEASSQTTVQIKGIASEVTDASETQRIFTSIVKISMETSASGIPPTSKLQAGDYVVYHIKPKEIRMAVFVRPDPGDYDSIFETLNP